MLSRVGKGLGERRREGGRVRQKIMTDGLFA